MAYNNGREDRKWRIWKEAEEKVLREHGVDEATIEQIRIDDRADFNSNQKRQKKNRKGFVTFTVMGNTNSVVWRLYFYLHGGKYRCTGRDFFNWLPAIP